MVARAVATLGRKSIESRAMVGPTLGGPKCNGFRSGHQLSAEK